MNNKTTDLCAKCKQELHQDETIRVTRDNRLFHMKCIPDEPGKLVLQFRPELNNLIFEEA